MAFEGTKGGSDYSQGTDSHDTPLSFFEPIANAIGGFDLDPAASETSDLADRNVTEDEDGLSISWYGDVWLNPPYSAVDRWLEYGRSQCVLGDVDTLVALVFARTSTQWFHEHAVTADIQCFIEGRLTFGDGAYNAPAPSLLLIWGAARKNWRLLEHLNDIGLVCRPQVGSYTTQQTLWGINK